MDLKVLCSEVVKDQPNEFTYVWNLKTQEQEQIGIWGTILCQRGVGGQWGIGDKGDQEVQTSDTGKQCTQKVVTSVISHGDKW